MKNIKTTLADFAAGSLVYIDHGAGIEVDECIIVRDPIGTLDSAIGHERFIPVVRLRDGMLWLKRRDQVAIPATK